METELEVQVPLATQREVGTFTDIILTSSDLANGRARASIIGRESGYVSISPCYLWRRREKRNMIKDNVTSSNINTFWQDGGPPSLEQES
ncbi:hypothetical protein BaRGS_00036966 [Batillaria attramentaria]|uniref:Uncharacterized protein n=1 Tax=Batillaria attramentaria TaxID=370345 RepID=A0ABD0JB52_9CAEN